jgi:outer membrane PBP1 activator LpoA protein
MLRKTRIRTFVTILLVLMLSVFVLSGCGSSTSDTTQSTEQPEVTASSEPSQEPVQESKEPDMTTAQENAYKAALNYLDLMAFSKDGLINQLINGDGYDQADAEFAVNLVEENGEVDWNEQAVKAAQNYLDLMSFSRDGLVDQLINGDKYTAEQAEYAATQVYDK